MRAKRAAKPTMSPRSTEPLRATRVCNRKAKGVSAAWKPIAFILIITATAGALTAALTVMLAPTASAPTPPELGRPSSTTVAARRLAPRSSSGARPDPAAARGGQPSPAAPVAARLAAAPSRAYALARRSSVDAAALRELEELEARGDDPRVTRALIWGLSRADPERALPRLKAIARAGEEAAMRIEAVRSLIALKTDAAFDLVAERLRDDAAAEVRREAATLLSLARAGDEDFVPALSRAAEVDDSPAVRRAAIDGLGVAANPSSLAALDTLRKAGRSPEERLQAEDILKRLAILGEAGGADLTEAFGPPKRQARESERPR